MSQDSEHHALIDSASEYLEDHHTYHRYGGRQKIRELEPDPKYRYCGGLIVLPRLRQKFIKSPETGEYVLAREREERKTPWLELFYDLIFVALVSQLTHALAGDPSHLLRFATLYLIIWRSWHGPTMFSTRYDTSDLINKWYFYFQMVAIVAMGINLHPAYTADISLPFDVAYLVFRAFHFLMYLLAHLSEASSVTLQSIIVLPIFSIPFIVVLFRPDLAYIMWPLGAISEELSHWIRAILTKKISPSSMVPISIEHLTERNGLFVMIILGECVAGSMFRKSMEGEIIGWQFYIASALGLLIAFSIQWIYFDTEGRPKKAHALRRSVTFGALWGAFHVPLVAFVMVGSAGMIICMESLGELETVHPPPGAPSAAPEAHETLIFSSSPSSNSTSVPSESGHHGHHELPSTAQWLLSVGIGSAVLVAAALGLLSEEYSLRIRRRWTITLRCAIAVVTILVPLMTGKNVSIVAFLSIISSLTFLGALCSLIGGLRKPKPKYGATPAPPEETQIDVEESNVVHLETEHTD